MGQSSSSSSKYCPPPGASLPPPTVATIENLPLDIFPDGSSFLTQYQGESWYPTTTFAIQASIGGTTVFKHASYRTGNGIQVPSGDVSALFEKQTRIASITKAFTVLAVLLSKGLIGWHDSITKYVPQLDKAGYENVTIAALAGQTSGLGRYGYTADISVTPGSNPEDLGLPILNETLPDCDPYPGSRICTPQEELAMYNTFKYFPPSPNSVPLYSNTAYNLLGIALSNVYHKPYSMVMDELIFKPNGMTHSGFATPNDTANAILPATKEDKWFSPPFGNYDPSGGIWSTPDDLFLWTKNLLDNKLLPPAETRAWLQPASSLPSLHQLVGAPWEIFRPTDLNIKSTRPIDVITKSGGIAGYASYSIIVPEYNIAIAITAAGNDAGPAMQALLPATVKPLIAYADQEARKQVQEKYVGTYSSSHTRSSFIVALDDGPGLALKTFTVNGVDVLKVMAKAQNIKSANPTARLYPSDKDSSGKDGKERWNILWDREITGDGGFAQMQCGSWNWGEVVRYLGVPLDTVTFHVGERGNVASVELPGWRTSLVKSE
ncbi:beta-lactamase/transpeptidase-like protein [Lentithecium fluviatile CBS 122367]|uniref:Beta-lactamase/transpeptidase-like protein n=1 Tax=Lentithecium fluviatile CBS 122367 TaxID=1168545 RepID=A0A6G1IGH8_9PLEO|nr:beta-lactamase/transpeptidase-like protein [Lentithecium fluviatile CBS 122367]